MADTRDLASGYTRVNDTQFSAALFLLERLAIPPGARVLDVGCGPGNLTLHLAGLVGKKGTVVGIDPSEERIAIARQTTSDNVSYFVGVAEDLSLFNSQSFDVCFVNSTLHWVQDQGKALEEFARVLVPGGRLGISGGSGDYVAAHERIKENVLSRSPYRDYLQTRGPKFLKESELEGLLDRAGFGSRDIVTNTIVKSAPHADAMINWLDTSSSGQTYGGIPVELQPRAREEMKREWDKLTTAHGICMEMELLVTVATRE